MASRILAATIFAGLFVPMIGVPAIAQGAGAAFLAAEQSLDEGTPQQFWSEFDRAVELFWAEAPLSFRAATLVDSSEGYGRYVLRDGVRYQPDDSLTAYLEPVGYGWTAIGDDFRIRFDLDLEITSEIAGTLLAEPGFAIVERLSQNRSREFQATIELTVPDLPTGRYQLRLTFSDAATGKSAAALFDLEIIE